MPHPGRLGSTAVGVALALLLTLAAPASARKFQMSGTWVIRNGQVFLPLQFAAAGMDMTGHPIHASMGNLTGAFGFPNGPIPGKGGVTATGSAPATLRVPPHRFVEDAMQLGLRRGGDNAFRFNFAPLQVGHNPFGSSMLRRSAVGGLGAADAPSKRIEFQRRGFVTQPTMAPAPFQPILYPGPKLTTMFGLSTTGPGNVFYLPQIGTGPMGTRAGQFTTQYGFGQTTGTVLAQQTMGTRGQDFFTVMGSDARTALGAGNISLVAGGLSFRTTAAGTTPYASFHKLKLTLAPPIPSLSPAGMAAAAAR